MNQRNGNRQGGGYGQWGSDEQRERDGNGPDSRTESSGRWNDENRGDWHGGPSRPQGQNWQGEDRGRSMRGEYESFGSGSGRGYGGSPMSRPDEGRYENDRSSSGGYGRGGYDDGDELGGGRRGNSSYESDRGASRRPQGGEYGDRGNWGHADSAPQRSGASSYGWSGFDAQSGYGQSGGQGGRGFGGQPQAFARRGYGGSMGSGLGSSGGYGTQSSGRGSMGAGSYGSGMSGMGSGQQQGERGGFFGRGPKGYRRSDERIQEEVSERLKDHDDLDASEIEVTVNSGTVTLSGTVPDRQSKRLAEQCAEECSGVDDVTNQIRVAGKNEDKDKDSKSSSSNASGSKSTIQPQRSQTSSTTSQSARS